MYVAPIGVMPVNVNKPSFNGQVKIKGSNWNPRLLDTLMQFDSPSLERLLEGHDVIVRQVSTRAGSKDPVHYHGEPLYKIMISRVKEGSVGAEIADVFNLLPRKSLTRGYHSSFGLVDKINEKSFRKMAKRYSVQ